jgi:hypothetical protein
VHSELSTPLTDEQHSVIIGSLLGDGGMRCKRNALLEINHCAAQRSYVDWKYTILLNIVGTPPKLRAGNGMRSAYRFTTLAVWFMDDGSRSRRSVYFNTQQFDDLGQQRLLNLLSRQFGIEGTLNRDKQYHRIRISVESVPRLSDTIAPYILSEFRYKLPDKS